MRWQERAARVAEVAGAQGGVLSRPQLNGMGISRHEVKREARAGRWRALGLRTIAVVPDLQPVAYRWRAVWESGERARLDGASALQAAGLKGWHEDVIHVSVPRGSHGRRVDGVRIHAIRRLEPPSGAGVPTTGREMAAIRAGQWARSDRAAATILVMAAQQRIVHPARLEAAWSEVGRSPRRAVLDLVITAICGGVQSLNELDFAAICRRRGLPPPTRQVVRCGPRGRIYLDVFWEDLGVAVEIDGAQHGWGLSAVDDALRDNEIRLDGIIALSIPVLGLHLDEDAFMGQVERALALGRERQKVRAL